MRDNKDRLLDELEAYIKNDTQNLTRNDECQLLLKLDSLRKLYSEIYSKNRS